ncbi:hypothetical protein CDAR_200171 [Caerostris darwini]|uniref:Uncharacterized protein n=1 Tax=Caerostris darwini TaxID=1538125 RepID=A0AAV4PQN8_9ARAC|nr:hypothetical protein CDAR_200171 [Caerostris darwini]
MSPRKRGYKSNWRDIFHGDNWKIGIWVFIGKRDCRWGMHSGGGLSRFQSIYLLSCLWEESGCLLMTRFSYQLRFYQSDTWWTSTSSQWL